jgi:glutamyl-tRNA synthetase
MEEVRVRFAPSPTGFLHVGGARTAIFNWLFARSKNGKFLLRIEDTDPQRSKSELSEQIIRSLEWLKMQPDEPIVYQSDRIERYREAIIQLVKTKKAYYCFETAEELEQKRKVAKEKNLDYYKYDRSALQLSEDKIKNYLDEGREYTIRFYVPDGVTVFEDIVHGNTSFSNAEIDDFVILRSDGSPVYQIAVVVDDHDMNITHIIRGDDHLSNTPKQILLYQALNWDIPKFAHLPMILDEDKKKLSKRRNPVAVEEYRDKGYLSEALFNFLTLLGYAPENNREIISCQELIKSFTFDRVNKKSAVFDKKKLDWINFEYIRMKDDKEIAEMIKERLNKILNKTTGNYSIEYIIKVVKQMKARVNTINEFTDNAFYFFTEPESYDEKAFQKFSNDESKKLLYGYLNSFNSLFGNNNYISAEEIENHLRNFTDSNGIKAGKLIHPLRLALTGMTATPGIFELMEIIGIEKIKKRIEKFIQ